MSTLESEDLNQTGEGIATGELGHSPSSHTEISNKSTDEKADSTFNDKDEYKYPVDKESGFRVVTWVASDKENPKNLSNARKWLFTAVLGFACFIVAFGSAIVTGGLERPMETFKVSKEVIILASVTVFVIGFGVGPLLFAPLSEQVGRKPIYATTLLLAVIFIIPCGLAQNIGTLIVCRLIDGILFSAPMTLIGGSLADIWEGHERGFAMAIFSSATYLGPVAGPIFGGLLGDYAPTWRWIYWTFLIVSGFMYVLLMVVVPETYATALLRKRAKKLVKLTGDDRYRCHADLQKVSFLKELKISVFRPFALLSELIVFLITVYMSVNYGLLYMFFLAYPVVYVEGKGWSESKTGVMFIPIGVGVLLSIPFALYFNKDYNRRAQVYRDRDELPPPELRLIPMMATCWILPCSLFAWGWSSYPTVSWAGPCFSGLGAGFAFTALYNPGNNYLVDSYQHYAASALAAKTFVRSMWGAGVVLFTTQMYHKLGYQWATSLMAFISLACCLIPFLFYRYGKAIRRFSRYAYSPEME